MGQKLLLPTSAREVEQWARPSMKTRSRKCLASRTASPRGPGFMEGATFEARREPPCSCARGSRSAISPYFFGDSACLKNLAFRAKKSTPTDRQRGGPHSGADSCFWREPAARECFSRGGNMRASRLARRKRNGPGWPQRTLDCPLAPPKALRPDCQGANAAYHLVQWK
jgi:hypothetical protein